METEEKITEKQNRSWTQESKQQTGNEHRIKKQQTNNRQRQIKDRKEQTFN